MANERNAVMERLTKHIAWSVYNTIYNKKCEFQTEYPFPPRYAVIAPYMLDALLAVYRALLKDTEDKEQTIFGLNIVPSETVITIDDIQIL